VSFRIEDLNLSNIDDLIYVCSKDKLQNPVHRKGIEIKKKWLRRILREVGPIAKIAYFNNEPVAQILYYPEEIIPALEFKRKQVICIHCIYNSRIKAQKRGIGKSLLRSLLEESQKPMKILNGKPCRFIIAKSFDTGEFLPLPEFYKRMGFKQGVESSMWGGKIMYLEITDKYEPLPPIEEYKPLKEDRGRVIVFYSPICQFSYQFAYIASRTIKEIVPSVEVRMINKWEKPDEFIKRKGNWLIVNAKPIKSSPLEKDRFVSEVIEALGF